MTNPKIHSLGSSKQEERLIIYIDILGFKEFINNMDHHQENKLIIVYQFLRRNICIGQISNTGVFKPSFTFFSDTLVFSWPKSTLLHDHSLSLSIHQSENIQRVFLKELNLLCRGVIHVGKIYHNHPVVYGKGLIQAYQFESEQIKVPKIVITEEAESFFTRYVGTINHSDAIYGNKLRYDSSKKHYYINPLNFLTMEPSKDDSLRYKKIIEHNISKHAYNNSVLQKWIWFAEEFNKVVLEFHSIPNIKLQNSKYSKLHWLFSSISWLFTSVSKFFKSFR